MAVTPRADKDGIISIAMCHCNSCRHVTGELFVSYMPVRAVTDLDLSGTSRYTTADGWTRLFCPTCGCHVLRMQGSGELVEWEVATGVLTGPEVPASSHADGILKARYKAHVRTPDTGDGGSSVWLADVGGHQMETLSGSHEDRDGATPPPEHPSGTLPAFCACGTVAFHITRPDTTSLLPSSYLPDLTHAYCSTDPSIVANSNDIKWWLRPDGKYLAGTCACRSCRLVSGFEIQTWAFVPRSNIVIRVPSGESRIIVPLDFNTLPEGILKSYISSPDVVREFCGKCGATVFWGGRLRPELIDVSVGLLNGEGARAGAWLDWWTERVSFSEDAETGRRGPEARRARELVSALERGLKAWPQRGH